jgi:hypothetical protein
MSSPRILLLSTMRNEGPHLVEWVAHHRAAGADDILVFSNDCSDGSDRLLDALAASGTLVHLPNTVPRGKTPQWAALKAAAAHPLVQRADWIAVLDCDEFVNLRAPLASLQELVEACPGADAILLPWRLFGHSGHLHRPKVPTLAAYTRAIRADALYPPLSRFFKTLYRRAGPFQKPGVHRPRQKPNARPAWRDGSGQLLPDSFAAAQDRILLWGEAPATGLVQLNHYSVRSAEDFLLKAQRGLPNRTAKLIDLAYWVERNFNEVEDRSIARMAPATEAEAARLRSLPGVAAAETASLDWHRAKFDALMQDPATVKSFGRLAMSESRSPDRDTALALVNRFQAAQSVT